jgi:hypothetical protein
MILRIRMALDALIQHHFDTESVFESTWRSRIYDIRNAESPTRCWQPHSILVNDSSTVWFRNAFHMVILHYHGST